MNNNEHDNTSSDKKIKLAILVTVGILLVAVIGLTAAYFIAGGNFGDGSGVTVKTDDASSLDFINGVPISLVANIENFSEDDGTLSGTTSSKASYKAPNTDTEDYQVYFEVESNNYEYTTVEKTPEIMLTITDPDGNEIKNITGFTHTSVVDAKGVTITGFDITEFTGLIKIKEDQLINGNTPKIAVEQTWTIKISFINLNSKQTLNEGKTLNSRLILQNDKITEPFNEYLINNHNELEHGLIQHTSADPNSDQSGDYRYSGSDTLVKNYITFNDEMWRIIGVFDTEKADGTSEPLVKIIKDESIGTYEFDVGNQNAWSINNGATTADLNTLLNEYYYNSTTAPNLLADCGGSSSGSCNFTTTGLSSEARAMTEEVKWSLRAPTAYFNDLSTTYYKKPLNWYNEEKSGAGKSSVSGADTEWSGKIGLMYPSDYLYGASRSYWDHVNTNGNTSNPEYSDNTGIKTNNWMFNLATSPFEWTITPQSSDSGRMWSVYSSGSVTSSDAFNGFSSRPVLYLSSGVKIVSGTGSSADPFQVKN